MPRFGRRGIVLSLFINSVNICLYLIILVAACLNIAEASVNFIILNAFAAALACLLIISEIRLPLLTYEYFRFLCTYRGRGMTYLFFGCLVASPIPFNLYGSIVVVCMGLAGFMLSFITMIPPLDGLLLNYKKLDLWKEQRHFKVQLEAQRIYEQQLQQDNTLTIAGVIVAGTAAITASAGNGTSVGGAGGTQGATDYTTRMNNLTSDSSHNSNNTNQQFTNYQFIGAVTASPPPTARFSVSETRQSPSQPRRQGSEIQDEEYPTSTSAYQDESISSPYSHQHLQQQQQYGYHRQQPSPMISPPHMVVNSIGTAAAIQDHYRHQYPIPIGTNSAISPPSWTVPVPLTAEARSAITACGIGRAKANYYGASTDTNSGNNGDDGDYVVTTMESSILPPPPELNIKARSNSNKNSPGLSRPLRLDKDLPVIRSTPTAITTTATNANEMMELVNTKLPAEFTLSPPPRRRSQQIEGGDDGLVTATMTPPSLTAHATFLAGNNSVPSSVTTAANNGVRGEKAEFNSTTGIIKKSRPASATDSPKPIKASTTALDKHEDPTMSYVFKTGSNTRLEQVLRSAAIVPSLSAQAQPKMNHQNQPLCTNVPFDPFRKNRQQSSQDASRRGSEGSALTTGPSHFSESAGARRGSFPLPPQAGPSCSSQEHKGNPNGNGSSGPNGAGVGVGEFPPGIGGDRQRTSRQQKQQHHQNQHQQQQQQPYRPYAASNQQRSASSFQQSAQAAQQGPVLMPDIVLTLPTPAEKLGGGGQFGSDYFLGTL